MFRVSKLYRFTSMFITCEDEMLRREYVLEMLQWAYHRMPDALYCPRE